MATIRILMKTPDALGDLVETFAHDEAEKTGFKRDTDEYDAAFEAAYDRADAACGKFLKYGEIAVIEISVTEGTAHVVTVGT